MVHLPIYYTTPLHFTEPHVPLGAQDPMLSELTSIPAGPPSSFLPKPVADNLTAMHESSIDTSMKALIPQGNGKTPGKPKGSLCRTPASTAAASSPGVLGRDSIGACEPGIASQIPGAFIFETSFFSLETWLTQGSQVIPDIGPLPLSTGPAQSLGFVPLMGMMLSLSAWLRLHRGLTVSTSLRCSIHIKAAHSRGQGCQGPGNGTCPAVTLVCSWWEGKILTCSVPFLHISILTMDVVYSGIYIGWGFFLP